MTAATLISPTLPSLKLGDTSAEALAKMALHRVTDLAVVDEGELMGLLSEDELKHNYAAKRIIEEVNYGLAEGAFIYDWQHGYDLVSMMTATGRSVVPVLDRANLFLGSAGRKEALAFVAEMTGATEAGGIIVLEVVAGSYQPREIASIIESNNAQLISLYVAKIPDSVNLYVTLKLNVSELSQILLSFERYGYKTAFTFFDQRQLDDTQSRYEALVRYLNV